MLLFLATLLLVLPLDAPSFWSTSDTLSSRGLSLNALSPEGLTDQDWLTSLYIAYWERSPDPEGLKYWKGLVAEGKLSILDAAELFAMQTEAWEAYDYFQFPDTATGADRQIFILAVYQNLMNREAEPQGLEYWSVALGNGEATPGAVIGHIIHAAMQLDNQDWHTIFNKIQVAGYYAERFEETSQTWTKQEHRAQAAEVLEGITHDPDTVTAGKQKVDQLLQAEDITTSSDLILQALDEGLLDEESGYIYQAFATFNDPRLPEEFRGDAAGIEDPDFLWKAKYHFEDLSEETQETLAPFLIPPMYNGSWWDLQENWLSQQEGQQNTARLGMPCNPVRENCPLLVAQQWKYLSGENINVWYQTRHESEDLARAQEVMRVIEQKAWPDLTAHMGREPLPDRGPVVAFEGPDSKMDIALVDMSPLGQTHASFFFKGCGNSPTYILINRSAGDENLGPIAVHEFMHAIQFAQKVKDCLTLDYKTLMESTANWAVDYVYGTQKQWEHQHIYAYNDDITRSLLDETPNIRPYGAYLFPFFLTNSGDLGAVQRTWDLAQDHSQPQVYEELVELEDIWPEFAAKLWNQPPFDEFRQWDQVNRQVKTGLDNINLDLAGAQYKDTVLDPYQGLPGLSAHLFHVVFHDPMIRTAGFFNGFTFDLGFEELEHFGQFIKASPLSPEQPGSAQLHALAKINGEWDLMLRNWTDIPYVLFPQDLPHERTEELLLVYTNSSSDTNEEARHPGLPSHFWLTNMPSASPWEGVIDLSQTVDGVTTTFKADNIRFEQSEPESSALIEAPYHPDGAPWAFKYNLTSGSATWSISGTDSSGCTYSGSDTNQLSTGFMPNQFMLCQFIRSGPALYGYVLNGFDQHPPIEWKATVTCPDPEGGTSTQTEFMSHGEFWMRLVPGLTDIKLSTNGMSLHGTGDGVVGDSVTGHFDFYAVN